MTRPSGLELADIVRRHGPEFLARHAGWLQPEQRRALRAIAACRTAALGGHVSECDACAHREISYNSCRNRHCPKCQGAARAEWVAARERELLPVEYFHVVFTLPAPLAALARTNKRRIYDLLFESVWRTLSSIASDPHHLGAEIGYLAVLHTWGQTLTHHPHLHCIIPGGGLSPDHTRWVSCRKGFLLSVRVLSRRFRTIFLERLEQAFERGDLSSVGGHDELAAPARFAEMVGELRRYDWVVYAKPPFGGPKAVLRYLGRYTHRIAISNSRLRALDDGHVTFTYKDYRTGHAEHEMRLEAVEFLRRFVEHVLPRGFKRIRQYGYLANRCRATKLELCRRLLGVRDEPVVASEGLDVERELETVRECPQCRSGRMQVVEELGRVLWIGARRPPPTLAGAVGDTS